MNRKITIGIGLIFVSLLVACGSLDNGDTLKDRHIEKEVSIDSVDEINIDIEISKVNINKCSGDKVEIQGDLSEYSKGLDVKCKGGTLIISEESRNKGLNSNDPSEISIMIPERYDKDLTFTYGASESDIKNITVDKMTIKGGAGKCSISDIVFKDLDMNAGVGETDIYLDEECGDIDVDGGVGSFNLNMTKVGGNLKYSGGVGEAKITIPENAPVSIKGESGLGEFNSTARTSMEGKYIFDVKTGIGKVSIEN